MKAKNFPPNFPLSYQFSEEFAQFTLSSSLNVPNKFLIVPFPNEVKRSAVKMLQMFSGCTNVW